MNRRFRSIGAMALLASCRFVAGVARADDVAVVPGLSGLNPQSLVSVKADGERLIVSWPTADTESARLTLRLVPGRPVVEELSIADLKGEHRETILKDADPVVGMSVGSREQGKNRPPGMSVFNEFFDNPHTRQSTRHDGVFKLATVKVDSDGSRAGIRLGGLVIGPFSGDWRFTVFAGSRLVKVEAVVKTDRDRVAFLYDAGIVSKSFEGGRVAWTDTEGRFVAGEATSPDAWKPAAVRHRAIGVEVGGASLIVTPPPHQFFFPRDFTHNVHTVAYGRDASRRPGLGIRQDETGGGNFVPWFTRPRARSNTSRCSSTSPRGPLATG